MNPPFYSSTRSQGLVPPPFVEESPHEAYGAPVFTPGRFAPTWLEDFLTGKLYTGNGKVGCTTDEGATSGEDKRHILLIKGHQSFQEGSSEPYKKADGNPCDEVYSCVCQNCRHHFTFYIWRSLPDKVSDANRRLCGLTRKNQEDPFHHLLPVESETYCPSSINAKFYPFLGSSTFVCSAVKCPFKVAIEISGPRLTDEHLAILCDKDKIRERLRIALETDPTRFSDVANITPDALVFLRYYMRDIVEAKHDASGRPLDADRKIDQRNKKFCIQFGNGPEAHKLFTFLGFTEVVEGEKRSWRVPAPVITRPTQPGSPLAFYQDIKSEIETILGRESQTLRPNAAISFITNALDFADYPQSPFAGKDQYKAEDYATLGLLPNMHESIFWWAFRCQTQTCPQDELRFFEATERLAIGRNCDDLLARIQSVADQIAKGNIQTFTGDQDDYELEMAKQMSLTEDALPPSAVNNAGAEYTFFGLPEGQRSDDQVADKFTECLKNYPSQKSGYRAKLLKIARFRNNAKLRDLALQDIDLDEALDYLHVHRDTDISYLESTAQAYVNANELDVELAARALKVVGDSRSPDEREYLYNVANSFMEEEDIRREKMLLAAGSQANRPSLPIGLVNIRNTCYLNSILQYLFTVKEIRKIVLEYDDYALPDTDESLASRRIEPGQNTLNKIEVYAGRQFVMQLSALFQDLTSSDARCIRPPQRLALAALKNAAQLEADGKRLAEAQKEPPPFSFAMEGPSVAPPVPPRSPAVMANPPSSPNLPSAQHAEGGDVSDAISIKSSETLVDLTEEDREDIREISATAVEVPPDDDTAADEQTGKAGDVKADAARGATTADSLPAANKPGPTEETCIELALNDSSVEGTDQQDVEEVMGNILSHLRAAVKATGDDPETDMQTDPITNTFYWTSATYTRKIGNTAYSRLTSPGRVMTAYPNEKDKVITLLQALDGSFKREFITDNGLEQFTSIVKLPPILHIHIQRTTSTGSKNTTAINIPQTLRLDRFMDCAEGSDLMRRRRRCWNLQERLLALTEYIKWADPSESYEEVVRSTNYSADFVEEYLDEHPAGQAGGSGSGGSPSDPMDVDARESEETVDGDYVVINDELKEWLAAEDIEVIPPSVQEEGSSAADGRLKETHQWSSLPATKQFFEDAIKMTPEEMQEAVLAEGTSEEAALPARDVAKAIAETNAELDTIFNDLQAPENEYILHAVVCHAGSSGRSGHYWVWMYDFERRVWRRYNDSEVTEEPDNDKVLRGLVSGEPYYLAYVRASEVADLVDVPLRQAEAASAPEPGAEPEAEPEQTDRALMPPPPPPRPTKEKIEAMMEFPPPPTPPPAKEEMEVMMDFPPPPTPPPPPSYDEANAEYYHDQLRTYANAPPAVDANAAEKGQGQSKDQGAGGSDVEMAPAQ